MKKKIIWLVASCLMVAILPLASCATAVPEGEVAAPPDTTPPSEITGLIAADAYDGRVNLSWDKSTAEDFDHYNIYVSESEIVDVTGMTPIHQIGDIATNAYEVAELEEGTEYYFAVTAVDNSGNENTRVAGVSATPPLAPKVIRIEETDSVFVYTLGWKPEQNPEASGGSWTLTHQGAYGHTDIKVDIEFSGTGISLVYLLAPFGGIADIKIDGKDYPSVDMYTPSTEIRITTIATDLTNADHILTISPSENSNPAVSLPEGGPTEPVIVIDAVEVTVPQSEESATIEPSPMLSLRSLADDLDIDWGTAIMPMGMNDTLYMKTISQQFNLLVPDYGMYMADLQPQQGVWDFSDMDKIVEYGKSNNMKIRGHALVWGQHYSDIGTIGEDWTPTPAWVHNGNFSREDMIDIMYDHITTVVNRYENDIDEWVVVNESASWAPEGGFANNVWKDKLGENYVELAFRKAKEVAPNAILILNEYGGDYIKQTTYGREDNIYNHVKVLVERGVPIDAIGLEFHLSVPEQPWENEPTVSRIVSNFDRYGDLGLDVYITELDVKIEKPLTQEKLERQAEIYATIMQAVLASDDCKSITVWGYTDAYSWITTFDTFPGYSAACLFDENIEPKPAYNALMDVLIER